jgi:hypothetical protein
VARFIASLARLHGPPRAIAAATLLTTLVGCGEVDRAAAPARATSEPAGSAAGPDPDVARCALAVMTITEMLARAEPRDVVLDYARGCAGIYRESTCRAAWIAVATDTLDGGPRLDGVFRACSAGYCPRLPEPKPKLCTDPAAEGTAVLAELNDAILARELAADHALTRAVHRLFAPAVVDLPDPGPIGDRVVFGIDMFADGSFAVDGARVLGLDEVEAAARKAASRNEDVRAVIRADKSVEHGRVIAVLDRLKQAGITKIAFGVTPTPTEAPP